MSSAARQLTRVITRPVKKLQKPRPLKTPAPSRHSAVDPTNLNVFDEIMVLAEAVVSNLTNGNFDRNLQTNIASLSELLKSYGQNLELIYKDQLDRAFVIFRNGSRDENLDYISRLHLLELIELRAMQWMTPDSTTYYRHKYNHPDIDMLSLSSFDSLSLSSASSFQANQAPVAQPQPLLLGPGELVKSSGKFPAPTKVPGKNFCKDEVVIRNSDSGKVNTGAKERLVQITGPSEEKIIYARQLMEETIKRNASPVRTDVLDKNNHESTSSLNSSASDDGSFNEFSKRSTLHHSFSTSDATIGEYKYTVTIGDDTLKITGTNPYLVTTAKLVLDEYFLSESNEQYADSVFGDGTHYYDPVPYVPDYDANGLKGSQNLSSSFPHSKALKDSNVDTSVSSSNNSETDKCRGGKENSPVPGKDSQRLASSDSSAGNNPDQKSSNDPSSKSSMRKYSMSRLIHLADSPLSRRVLENHSKLLEDFPTIVKTLPIVDWFESKTYLGERQQETDTSADAKTVPTTSQPEQE